MKPLQQSGFLQRRPRHRRRSAVMLAEVLVVVALSGVILGAVISFLVVLQRYDEAMREHGLASRQRTRLAESIRADIRRGSGVSAPAADSLVVIREDGSEIVYELVADGCRRSLLALDSGGQSADLFRIGPAASWKLDTGPPGRRALHIVSLLSNKQNGEPERKLLLVYAALGADRATADDDAGAEEL